jgi:hypothetical protein
MEGVFMKAFKLVAGLVFAVCLIMGLGINVEAMEYLGDFCFRVEGDTKADDSMHDMRLAVVHIGNNHYSLYGKMVMDSQNVDIDGTEWAVNGNAEISSDGKIICTMVGSAGNDEGRMGAMTFRMKLDSSYNGRFQAIGLAVESDTEIQYGEGNVTKVPCQ